MSEERPWTLEEAAEWLQRDPETVRRWARGKKLKAEKLGREWRFAPDDVRALLPKISKSGKVSRDAEEVATLKAQLDAAYARTVLRGRTA